jgi:YjbE family integral membrane protein
MIEASSGALAALLQVLMIDLVLAGDNAVAVGLAAAGLPPGQRRKVIALGLAAAVVMRIAFALVTTQLLQVIGLLFGGGLLLLWVCWKMWRDLREAAGEAPALAPAGVNGVRLAPPAQPKSFKAAFLTILLADLSMSLDNVLAVAGAAREHPAVLVAGLLVSVALMGLAASAIARLLNRHRWIGYAGLAIVLYVALHMVWEGHRTMVVDLGQTEAYNALMPAALDIRPGA